LYGIYIKAIFTEKFYNSHTATLVKTINNVCLAFRSSVE